MNRINPIHIALLLLVLLSFFTWQLSHAKERLKDEKLLYQETLSLATQLQGLKNAYGNKQRVKKSLHSLLTKSSLASAGIKKKITSRGIILTAENINKKSLDFLLSKILNGSYNVTLLTIKRLDNQKATLKMEIKW